jgi:DNA-binding NarL/FixJ family response regulator
VKASESDAGTLRTRRIGVVATDPLRIMGLRAILDGVVDGRRQPTEIVPLSAPKVLNSAGLSVVLIDSDVTPYLMELLEAFRRSRPELRLIVMGDTVDPDYIERVIAAGAKGYLSHKASEEELRMAVGVVEEGSVWAPRRVMARLLEGGGVTRPKVAPVAYTARESQVLVLLSRGCSNREIALALEIDETTVKAHLGRLMRKLGVTNRTALTVQTRSKHVVSGVGPEEPSLGSG